jgi:hypothetical protein
MTTTEALVILAWDNLSDSATLRQREAVRFAQHLIEAEAEDAIEKYIEQYGPNWAKK